MFGYIRKIYKNFIFTYQKKRWYAMWTNRQKPCIYRISAYFTSKLEFSSLTFTFNHIRPEFVNILCCLNHLSPAQNSTIFNPHDTSASKNSPAADTPTSAALPSAARTMVSRNRTGHLKTAPSCFYRDIF